LETVVGEEGKKQKKEEEVNFEERSLWDGLDLKEGKLFSYEIQDLEPT